MVLVAGTPALYVERGGRGLLTLPEAPAAEEQLRAALGALAQAVRHGRVGRLALERIDGAPAIGSKRRRRCSLYRLRQARAGSR